VLSKFYADVLPQTGYFCLFDHNTKQHIWAESHDELVHRTQRFADTPNVYFGTAGYNSTFNRKAPNVRTLRSLRLDIDAGAKKLAKHPDGAYPTQRDAIAAFVGFVTATGLKPTYLISSGEGLHVYWCLNEDLAPADWEPLGIALEALCKQHRLKVDPTTTKDTTRILRPPGTVHHDDVLVTILRDTGVIWTVDALRAKLAVAAPEPEVEIVVPEGRVYDTSINKDAIIEPTRRAPVSAIAVAGKCAALHYVARKGGNVQEPYWRAMLGLVKHTIEGEALAHEWSHAHAGSDGGYDGYDFDATQKKIDGWNAGPTTCAEFSNHTRLCETCEFRSPTLKSPITLVNPPVPVAAPEVAQVTANIAPAAAPVAPLPPPPPRSTRPWEGHIPDGFAVKSLSPKPGYVMVELKPGKEETAEGQPIEEPPVQFTSTVFWISHWADADEDNVARVQAYKLNPDGGTVAFTIDQNVLAIRPKLIEFLGGQGIQLTNHGRAQMSIHNFARDAVRAITHTGQRIQIGDHLGIRILPNGELAATQGMHTIFANGRIERSMVAKKLEMVANQFTIPLPGLGHSDYGPDVWPYIEEKAKRHIAFLQKHFGGPGLERFQLAIMMGLASPFMAFATGEFQSGSVLPRGGLSVSLFSRESARGKTTAVQSAILAYGRPASLTNDGGALGATDNARVSRLAIHGTLPNIMDEMGSASSESVANAVHMVANGASRERGSREGGLNISAPFALINLITTNTSQRDMIANVQESSDAIQRRLLEINVDGMPDHSRTDRHSFASDWTEMNSQCVGALGAVIHREICKLGLQAMTAITTRACENADTATGGNVADRFQYRGLGAVVAMHHILSKIGIEIFPLAGVVEAFKVAHASGKEFIAQNIMPKGLELLSRLLHDLAPNTLVTETDQRRINGYRDAAEHPLNVRMPDVVQARHIRALGRTYLSVEAAKAWCRKHNVPETEFTKPAREEGIFELFEGPRRLSSKKFDLFKGMDDCTHTYIPVYSIDKRLLAQKLGLPMDDVTPPVPLNNVHPIRQS
jgi:hypothetical protein